MKITSSVLLLAVASVANGSLDTSKNPVIKPHHEGDHGLQEDDIVFSKLPHLCGVSERIESDSSGGRDPSPLTNGAVSEDFLSPVLSMSRRSLAAESSLKEFEAMLPLQTHHLLRGTYHDVADGPQTDHTPRQLDVTELTVMCVPWQGDPNKRHTVISDEAHRLKGVFKTPDTGTYYYKWDFGDGDESSVLSVGGQNKYNVAVDRAYTGTEGTPFDAHLMVSQDSADFTDARSCEYKIHVQDNTLDSRINVAIDNGLWFLYKSGTSTSSYYHTFNSSPVLVWSYSYYFASPTASAVHAFEINGHKESGVATVDPYVEAVKHGLNWLFHGYFLSTNYPMLRPYGIGLQREDNPDTNGNGIGIEVRDYYYRSAYEGGMVIDAIIASGTPDKDCGRDFDGDGNTDTYREVVQDMIDQYAWGQYDSIVGGNILGGWRYDWNDWPDNSAAQWAAIGMIPAEEAPWNCDVPAWVKAYNDHWLDYSYYQFPNGIWGGFGYTSSGWGTARTPSGMVQLDFVGAERTDSRWNNTERWFADNWATGYNWLNQNNMYAYYAFAKAMRLAKPEPIATFAINNFDWYRGDASAVGLAEKIAGELISGHSIDYYGHNLGTAWAIIILKPVLFSEAPIACFDADPNPNYPERATRLDPSCSDHAEAGKNINNLVQFEWDFDNDGSYDIVLDDSQVVEHSFDCATIPCIYPVSLRVTDDSDPARTATYVKNIEISYPPHPPVAVVLSPYMLSFCPEDKLVLDGSDSYDPNEGEREGDCESCPYDAITAWEWDLTGAPFEFLDESGELVDLGTGWDSYFPNADTYNIGLRVTDNTELSYPNSGAGNLNDEGFGFVDVYAACLCEATGEPLCQSVRLEWEDVGADMYYIYRSLTGPNLGFEDIGRTTETSKIAGSFVMDQPHWYRIMAETVTDTETNRCTSGPIEVIGPASLCNPTANPGGPYKYCKDEVVTLDGSGSTALAGTIVGWEWDFDNDGTPDGYGEQVDHEWTENGRYTVSLKVTSSDSLVLVDSETVEVEIGFLERCNEDPEIVAGVGTVTVDEGEVAEVSGNVTDADGDDVSLTASIGTVTNNNDETWEWVLPTSDGPSEVTVTIDGDDGNGGTDSTTFNLVVNNVAPTIDLISGPNVPVEVGTEVEVQAHFLDPGILDTHTGQCDFGDETTPTGSVDQEAMMLSASHTYDDDGVFTVTCTVTDNDGGSSSADYGSTIVVSHRPEALLTSDAYVVEEGGSVELDGTLSNDPDGDDMTYHWDLDGDGVYEIEGDSIQDFSAADLDDGTRSVGLEVCDDKGFCDDTEAVVEITNVAPTIDLMTGPVDPVEVGTEVLVEAHFKDPGTRDTHTGECVFGDDSDPTGAVDQEAMMLYSSHTYDGAGVFTITCSVTDDDGGSSSADYGSTIVVSHRPEALLISDAYVVEEGGSVQLDGTPSHDPDVSDNITYHWDLDGDGVYEIDGDSTQDFPAADLDDSTHSIGLKVCDNHGFCDTTVGMVEVTNVAPTIDSMTGPVDPVEVGTEVLVEAHFTDPGILDEHTFQCDFGDETGPTGTVDAATLSASHTYDQAGVFAVTCTVTDDDGGSSSIEHKYVLVFDPDGGCVTGGGRFESPSGAYRADTSLTGKATFGFVSKYKARAKIPTGQTQFRLKIKGKKLKFNFKSTGYVVLVRDGPRAMYTGVGTINRKGNYGFMLQTIDAKLMQGADVDHLRMKIWDRDDNDNVVYDNDLNNGDAASDISKEDTTKITKGSIVIHAKGGCDDSFSFSDDDSSSENGSGS